MMKTAMFIIALLSFFCLYGQKKEIKTAIELNTRSSDGLYYQASSSDGIRIEKIESFFRNSNEYKLIKIVSKNTRLEYLEYTTYVYTFLFMPNSEIDNDTKGKSNKKITVVR